MSLFTPEEAAGLPGPEWMRERRVAAAERFVDSGLPTEAEEIWRYSRISELDLDAYELVAGGSSEVPDGVDLTGVAERSALIITPNGRVVSAELDPALARRGGG